MASLWGELFGEDRFENRYLNKNLQGQIDESAATMPAWFRALGMKGVGELEAANPALRKKQEADTQEILGQLKGASGRAAGFDPVAVANLWANSNIDRAKSWLKTATGADSAAGKLARARLGYAGRPDSSYSQFLRTNEMAGQMNPMIAQILGGAGSDAARFGQVNNNTIGAIMQALGAVPDAYGEMADSYLRPARAAASVAGADANLLNQLGLAAKQNFLGLENKRKHGVLDYISQATKGLQDNTGYLAGAVGNVMGAIGNIYSMGAMGNKGTMGTPTDADKAAQFQGWVDQRQPLTRGAGVSYDMPNSYDPYSGYGGGSLGGSQAKPGYGIAYDLPSSGGGGGMGGLFGKFGIGG